MTEGATLFRNQKSEFAPLAIRLRPQTIEECVGHQNILEENAIIQSILQSKRMESLILYGPPGIGKTTLARIISRALTDFTSLELSAIDSGVAEIRACILKAKGRRQIGGKPTIIFIDEIHRLNTSQQDRLLQALEEGDIFLLGATTENPAFQLNPALRSRVSIVELFAHGHKELALILERALSFYQSQSIAITIEDDAKELLIDSAHGDARKMLSHLERIITTHTSDCINLQLKDITQSSREHGGLVQRTNDKKYDAISAMIKSLRGSDPDASLFYAAVLIDGGEDLRVIFRRLVIFASEDIGNADPHALVLTQNAFQAYEFVGMPEGRILLGQVLTYLASAPKSNRSYRAIEEALADARRYRQIQFPMQLVNAPTADMKARGRSKDYQYPHDVPGSYIPINYLPEKLAHKQYYFPSEHGVELRIKQLLDQLSSIREQQHD
jgi:putative ATPase